MCSAPDGRVLVSAYGELVRRQNYMMSNCEGQAQDLSSDHLCKYTMVHIVATGDLAQLVVRSKYCCYRSRGMSYLGRRHSFARAASEKSKLCAS